MAYATCHHFTSVFYMIFLVIFSLNIANLSHYILKDCEYKNTNNICHKDANLCPVYDSKGFRVMSSDLILEHDL